jgi:hypothetical protein
MLSTRSVPMSRGRRVGGTWADAAVTQVHRNNKWRILCFLIYDSTVADPTCVMVVSTLHLKTLVSFMTNASPLLYDL